MDLCSGGAIKGRQLAPDKALFARPPAADADSEPNAEPIRLVSLRLRTTGRVVEAVLDPTAESRITLTIESANRRIAIP
jgi:hypothetical protein